MTWQQGNDGILYSGPLILLRSVILVLRWAQEKPRQDP